MNSNRNKQIAIEVTHYLKNRLLFNQKILELNANKNNIPFEQFMEKYKALEKKIWSNSYNPKRNELVLLTNQFVENHSSYIILTEEEIDELLNLVSKSIEIYGLGDIPFSYKETDFLRFILRQIQKNIYNQPNCSFEDALQYKIIDKWLTYLYLNEDNAFYKPISGKLILNANNDFFIQNAYHQTLCFFKQNGEIFREISLDEEEIKSAFNLYVGYLKQEEDKIITLLYSEEKNFKNAQILYCNNFEQRFQNKDELYKNIVPINTFLESQKLDFFKKIIYTGNDLKILIDIFQKLQTWTEEEKEQIDNITRIASEWWKNIVVIYPNETNHFINSKKDSFQKFKQYLENEIRKRLIENKEFTLKVDNNPDRYLSIATYLSKLQLDFPRETTMTISRKEVKVSVNGHEEFLYREKQKKI